MIGQTKIVKKERKIQKQNIWIGCPVACYADTGDQTNFVNFTTTRSTVVGVKPCSQQRTELTKTELNSISEHMLSNGTVNSRRTELN